MAGKYTVTLELGDVVEFAVFDEDDNPIATAGAGFQGLDSALRGVAVIIREHAAAPSGPAAPPFPTGGPPGPEGT